MSKKNTGLRLASVVALSLLLVGATPAESPVADAAQANDVEHVRSLLRQGADANAAQTDGLTALHWAALNDNQEIAELVLYAGGAVKPLTRVGGYTPLHLAARAGHTSIVTTLLEAGADPNEWTTTGVTALHFAAQGNFPETVRALTASGAELDPPDSFQGRTPLVFAASRNATGAISALLEAGADPSAETDLKDYVSRSEVDRDERARRARIRAAEAGEEVISNDNADRFGAQTPPDSTQADDEEEKADAEKEEEEKKPEEPPVTVLSSTEQIGVQGGFTPLHYAARQGHIEAAELLLDGGADVDHVSGGDQSSPLLVATINGNYDLALMLVERGADPNVVSDDGVGPLFATLNIEWSLRTWYPQPQAFRTQKRSYLELMEALLEAGADPNQRTETHVWYAAYNAGRMGVDFTGATPFWRAAYATDVTAMRLLHAYGADPNIWTTKLPSRRRGFDPGNPASRTDEDEEKLDPSGLPPIPVGGPAVHPIHAASGVGFGTSRVAQQHRSVPDGWLPAMKYFVEELGIDPNLRDMDGYSPVHHSAARGDNETILYLVDQGADVTLVSRRGQTTADMANSPEQRAQPHPATIALLEKLGSKNNHNCQSCGKGSTGGNE
jgi:ankyrin repeat protein